MKSWGILEILNGELQLEDLEVVVLLKLINSRTNAIILENFLLQFGAYFDKKLYPKSSG
jgi:uncharacterized protein Smg (DUF494 family)